MNSVARLISKYELDDTVVNNGLGIFANGVIQDEYDRLLEKRKLNLTSALEVGVEIEEMDIGDIERMQEETDNSDIKRVLSNLLDGSNNHLDTFNTQLGLIPQ